MLIDVVVITIISLLLLVQHFWARLERLIDWMIGPSSSAFSASRPLPSPHHGWTVSLSLGLILDSVIWLALATGVRWGVTVCQFGAQNLRASATAAGPLTPTSLAVQVLLKHVVHTQICRSVLWKRHASLNQSLSSCPEEPGGKWRFTEVYFWNFVIT